MANINFPNSPSPGDTYSFNNSIWTYSGTAWVNSLSTTIANAKLGNFGCVVDNTITTGVYEFYVDCDGTTGYVNVDDWSTNYVKDTTKMDYWFMGMPEININGIPKERSVGFVY